MERAAEYNQEIKNRVDFFRKRPLEEFYDIKKDPNCLNNLISDPEYSKEIQQKRDELEKWMRDYNDPLLYVYENRENKEKIIDKLYELYPDLKKVDHTSKYPTVDGSPTKTEVLKSRHNPDTKFYWDWSFGKRPAEELYYLPDDPGCIKNLSDEDKYGAMKVSLKDKMEEELIKQNDPRMFGEGYIFHTYYYTWDPYRNLYERMVVDKEKIVPMWINASDIE